MLYALLLIAPQVLCDCAEEKLTFEQCQSAIADELAKDEEEHDIARLKKLFRLSHRDRRRHISATTDGVPKVLEMFPLLKKMKFVSI